MERSCDSWYVCEGGEECIKDMGAAFKGMRLTEGCNGHEITREDVEM